MGRPCDKLSRHGPEQFCYLLLCHLGFESRRGERQLRGNRRFPQTSSLPAGWAARDVGIATLWSGDSGDVGLAGNAQLSGGVYTLDGSGLDIWGAADSFQFAYRGVSGDCTLVARVTTLQDTDPWAKAGIMIREGLQWDRPMRWLV